MENALGTNAMKSQKEGADLQQNRDSLIHLAHRQMLDSALPVGAFAHSFGLETLVQSGLVSNASQLIEYSISMLRGTWAPCDALAIKGVYTFAAANNFDELWQLDREIFVSRAARESREASQKIGRRTFNLLRALHPDLPLEPLQNALQNGDCVGCHFTIYGWFCFHLGVSLDDAAEGYLQNCLFATASNAVRLMSLGQTEAQTIIARLLPEVVAAWREVRGRDARDFSSSTPLLEIAAMEHETLYSRLFMS